MRASSNRQDGTGLPTSDQPRPEFTGSRPAWKPRWMTQSRPPLRSAAPRPVEPRPAEAPAPYVPGKSPRLLLPQIVPLELAAKIIGKANREHPADTVLREELRASGNVYRSQSTEVSHAVFAYYRWYGWLDQHHPLTGQLKRALELTDEFAARPETFSDTPLVQRCVPAWIATHMDCPAGWVRTLQSEPSLWIRVRHGLTAQLRRNLERTAKSPLPNALR